MKRTSIFIMFLMVLSFMSSCSKNEAFEATESRKRCDIAVLTQDQVANVLYSKNLDSIQFIDIRNAHDFSVGHLPNAINVPMDNFLNKKYNSKIDKDKVLMIYGYDASSPRLISLLSAHYKLANLYVIMGGYDYLKNNILDNFGIYSGIYDDEVPLCDYANKMADVASRAGAVATKPSGAAKAAPAPMVKRKKKEVSGGCG